MSEQLYDPIRQIWVADQPEERVRQRLLDLMLASKGYPKSLLGVEVALKQMPHLALVPDLPSRRADIICYGKGIHPDFSLYPLLLIECKAVPLNRRTITQLAGYNHFVGAYYLAVANETEIKTGWYDSEAGTYSFQDGLPDYQALLDAL